MSKRINPYTRLLNIGKAFLQDYKYRHKKIMWQYPKDKLNSGWNLNELWERTKAAEQLGYEVKLIANNEYLTVTYEKKMPDIPYEFRD